MHFVNDQMEQAVTAIAHHYSHNAYEPPYSHTNTQLLHTVSGVIKVETEIGNWIVPPGRGLWIPEGMIHSLRTVGTVDIKTLFIDPLARADLPNQCQVYEVTPLLRELIIQAVNIKNPFLKGSRESRIIELILDELRILNILDFHVPMPKESSHLYELCTRISKRLDHPWSTSDASKLLLISDKTVSRQFHQQLGLSFGEWLRRKRLLESMELLAQGVNVIDAALSVGYESPSSFSSMFKSRVGISPVEYASNIGCS